MKNQWLTIKQLDCQLKEWKALGRKYGRPRAGWIKTLRIALSMSAAQFANRLGLTRARVNQLENAEIHDAITLRSLREAANALGCELVYAVVPKGDSTLESIIKTKAEQIAKERIARVAHSMSLEKQSLDKDFLKNQKNELIKDILEHLNKKFWDSSEPSDEALMAAHSPGLAEEIYNYIQKNKILYETQDEQYFNNIKTARSMTLLKNILTRYEKSTNSTDTELSKIMDNPKQMELLKKELIRLHKKEDKQKSQQNDLFKKLIEHLQKKK